MCFQTVDLLDAMRQDWGGVGDTVLRVDGGMVASDWTMQRLADLIGAPVDRPKVLETTALGAAYLAGLQAGLYPEPAELRPDMGAGPAVRAGHAGGRAPAKARQSGGRPSDA